MLAHMGKKVVYCGSSGAKLAAKICSNSVLGVQQIVITEAMLLGQELALEALTLTAINNNPTGVFCVASVNTPIPVSRAG